MATSVVPVGKLELHHLLGKSIPKGWATDQRVLATTDPGLVVKNVSQRLGGGLLPLGGEGEELGGHKGYGLALMVDILSGVLSGADFADRLPPWGQGSKKQPDNLGHFFGALKVDGFRPAEEFKTVIKLDPKHQDAYLALGDIYMLDRKHYPEARVIYEEYLRFDQENAKVYLNLGESYYFISKLFQAPNNRKRNWQAY